MARLEQIKKEINGLWKKIDDYRTEQTQLEGNLSKLEIKQQLKHILLNNQIEDYKPGQDHE